MDNLFAFYMVFLYFKVPFIRWPQLASTLCVHTTNDVATLLTVAVDSHNDWSTQLWSFLCIISKYFIIIDADTG